MKWIIAIFLFAFFATSYGLNWYPCDAMREFKTMTLETGFLEVSNLTATIYPRNKYTGEVLRQNRAELTISGMQEWWSPVLSRECREPGHYTTPGEYDEESWAQTLFLRKDMLCSIDLVSDNFFGTPTETIVQTIRHPSYPDFLATLNVSKSSIAFEKVFPGEETTRFNDYVMQLIPNHYKLSLKVHNFPWNETNEETHLVLILDGLATMNAPSALTASEHTTFSRFNLTSLDPKLPIAFIQDLDRGFLLDDIPYMNNMSHAGINYPSLPGGVVFPIPTFAFGFCQVRPPGFHPKTIYWDPQLTVLFAAEDPTKPAAPTSGKKIPAWIAAPIVGGVVLIVVIIIVIFIVSPKAQKVFTPFKNAQRSQKTEKQINNRWTETYTKSTVGAPAADA